MKRFSVFLIAAALSGIPLTGLAQIPFDIVELTDSLELYPSTWLEHAQTGQRDIYMQKSDLIITISPDERWILLSSPNDEGLDVVTYKIYVLSTVDFKLRLLSENALGAVFSPVSNYIFIATGPSPIIYNLRKQIGYTINNIPSGLENYPCWVADWSADGTQLIIHEQLRFDDSSSPRAWKLTLAP